MRIKFAQQMLLLVLVTRRFVFLCIAKRITVNGVSSNERCYCSLVAFREAFFVNKVHRKPENCGAKSCECMISVHREARYCERSEQ